MSRRARILLWLSAALLTGAPGAASAETWAIQVVDAGSAAAGPTSLGLDNGYPVISYFGAPRNLNFAALDPTSNVWHLRRVDAGGEYNSLAVDVTGTVHVSYIDKVALDLKYWRYSAGQGSIQVIDSETGQGGMDFFNSIQLDPGGGPHISYYYSRAPNGTATSDRLKFAEMNGSAWVPAFADPTVGRGRYNSLAIDGTSNPRIAYYEDAPIVANRKLRLARRTLGVWSTLIVDAAGDPGRFNSIALDASGRTRISYIAATSFRLRYASSPNDTTWALEDVAPVGATFSTTSLALDSNGNPHIAYYDGTTDSLKYASRVGGIWRTQSVDSVGDLGAYSSLELDSQDRPIISYYDATSGSIKIAYGDYPDGDSDGIPDAFDPCQAIPDCNQNGIVDGKEGGITPGAPGTVPRLSDESIFGCGSLAAVYGARGGGGPPRGGPPADLLPLLAPALYLLFRRAGRYRYSSARFSARA